MEDPNIDRLFKEGLAKRTFDWDETYWQAVEAEIEKKERKKRGFFFILFGIGTVVFGSLFYLLIQQETALQSDSMLYPTEATEIEFHESGQKSQIPPTQNNVISDPAPSESLAGKAIQIPVQKAGQPAPATIQNKRLILETLPEVENLMVEPIIQPATPVAENVQLRDIAAAENVATLEFLPIVPAPELYLKKLENQEASGFHFGLGVSLYGQSAVPSSWNTNWIGGYSIRGLAGYQFNEQFSLWVEPGLNSRLEQFAILKESTQSTYGLGLQEINYRLVPDALYFGVLPISIQMQINPRNSLFLGVEPAFLLGAHGQLEEWVYKGPDERTDEEAASFEAAWREATENGANPDELPNFYVLAGTQKGWLDSAGLNRFQAAARIGYTYQVNPDISLRLLGRYRFTSYASSIALTSNQSKISIEIGINYLIK
ncbi:MAG: hypothetical protein KDC34_05455 [Saprospiraceae bacterium]|nr:hypothetical protein [Saprospiraceae bacterium]